MYFTDNHEWIVMQDSQAMIGITKYAQQELGEIVYIQLPKVGTFLKSGQEAVVLESTKAASDIYSPLTGEVIAINEKLLDSPHLLNHFPEDQGWLFKVQVLIPEEMNQFMDRQAYQKMVEPIKK